MKQTYLACVIASLLAPAPLLAEEVKEETVNVERIEVTGVRQRLEQAGVLADTITKTELIGSVQIEKMNAVNLTEAVDKSAGVKVSNECSMCGVKRIMLNGMKGEQTTILVDGLPVHTMISGFYAVDAIPTSGIESIEVARGAGASLTAPEAIGGTINIITKEPFENGVEVDVSAGENGYRKVGIVGYGVSEDGKTRVTLIGQYDDRDQVDEDNNKVNEQPLQENRSITARISQDIGDFDNVVLRVSNIESELFGGPMLGETLGENGRVESIGQVLAGSTIGGDVDAIGLFEGNDVRNNYEGEAWQTSEWVKTVRNEASLSWLHEYNDKLNMTLAASYADHEQDSFYEGFDYYAEDDMLFLSARFNYILNDDHLLTFGVDNRAEEMRSFSLAGTSGPNAENFVSDSFDYDVFGAYVQDTWQVNDDLEVAFALRYDHLKADFIDPSKPGTEIDEDIISPRLDMRYMHTDRLTSRFSAGRGYRAPLAFFESDHGVLDSGLGFQIDIDDLERSNSANYSLAYEGDKLTAAFSIAWSEVENLASLEETEDDPDTTDIDEGGIPLLTQLEDDATVVATDIAVGYAVTDDLTVNLTAEVYDYDDTFKSSYSIAPTEERVILSVDYDYAGWELYTAATWYGSRDLTDYGYDGFNQIDATGAVVESSRKTTNAPSFVTVDFKATYAFNDTYQVYFGASNLFDYTQAGDEDSPLFFGPNDADGVSEGYDVAYIYGPLRGREAYAGFKVSF